jgi:hypothetical protein
VNEKGSVAPLGIGLALLSLFTVLATASAGTLFLADRRLTTVAEATALALATDNEIYSASNLNLQARNFISSLPGNRLGNIEIVAVSVQEGSTIRVLLCSNWMNPIKSYSISETGKICSEGLARRGK